MSPSDHSLPVHRSLGENPLLEEVKRTRLARDACWFIPLVDEV